MGFNHTYKDWYKSGEYKEVTKVITRATALKAFCKECVCGSKVDITNCTAKSCQLFPFRPYQKKL